MGKYENLRKLNEIPMKPVIRLAGQREKEKRQRRDRLDLFFTLSLKPNE
jgi:hypothetical protein